MAKWRPIESAPKDGHRILASGPHDDMDGRWVCIASWHMGAWYHDLPAVRELRPSPDRWLPLPPPPSSPQGEDNG